MKKVAAYLMLVLVMTCCKSGEKSAVSEASEETEDISKDSERAEALNGVSDEELADLKKREGLRENLAIRKDALATMKKEWSELRGSGLIGSALDEAKKKWARKALAEIGGSREFSELLDFLEKNGESDLRMWMLEDGLAEVAGGEGAAELRTWLRSLGPEQEKLAEQAGLAIGKGFLGDEEGLKSYLAAFTNDHIQSRILTGFTLAYTAKHPEEAVSKFIEPASAWSAGEWRDGCDGCLAIEHGFHRGGIGASRR